MKDKKKTLIITLNIVAIICCIISLIGFFKANMGFDEPLIWLTCALLLSCIYNLKKVYSKKKK